MWGFLIALLSGALMSLQGVLNTEVTKHSGVWLCAVWVQLTALATCALFWLFGDRAPFSSLFQIRPWYLLIGGVLGAFITWSVVKGMDRLGPARATLTIVVTQILVSYGIELFGLFGVEKVPFEWRRLLGAGIAIAGIVIFHL